MAIIYKITNKLNGKPYVGQTRQEIAERFIQHSRANSPLGKAMRQYGIENFTIEVLEECNSQEITNEREKFWIRELNSKVPSGYNRSDGGTSARGWFVKHKPSELIKAGRIFDWASLKRLRMKKLSSADVIAVLNGGFERITKIIQQTPLPAKVEAV